MAEKNLIGELDMYREAGIKPNFSDIAKRYGKDRHTVASYWRAEGGRPRDGRADRAGSFDAHIEEVAAKAQLPGSPRRASTSGCCTGIPARTWPATTPSPSSCARTASPSGPPTARSRTHASRRRPGCSCSSTGRSRSGWRTATASYSSSTCSRRRWAIPAGTYSSGRGPGRPTTWSGACTPRSRGSAACPASGSRTTCPPW